MTFTSNTILGSVLFIEFEDTMNDLTYHKILVTTNLGGNQEWNKYHFVLIYQQNLQSPKNNKLQ